MSRFLNLLSFCGYENHHESFFPTSNCFGMMEKAGNVLPGVFEYAQDISYTVTLGMEISGGQYGPEFAVVLSHVLTRAPAGLKEFYNTEYRLGRIARNMTIDGEREKLDAGLGGPEHAEIPRSGGGSRQLHSG